MFWLFQLVTSNPDDFWLNVVAGLPFLAADVLLLTLLLPWVIEKWTDRRWRPTRRVALGRIMLSYLKVLELGSRLQGVAILALDAMEDRSDKKADELAFALFKLCDAAREHVARAENALQTVMPILGPDQVRLLLDHHIAWANAVNEFGDVADMIARGVLTGDEILADAEASEIEGIGLQIAHDRLAQTFLQPEPRPEMEEPTGPIWSPLFADKTAQAWEVIVARVYGGVDLSDPARLARAERRRRRINDLRGRSGLPALTDAPTLLSLAETPTQPMGVHR
ncbi:hypothetical protein [Brevundimonas sp.]|jgi:hypothetical protein|uniref:hypothetical protein n=1 Tax=Brevundimonas sp. TaxID=1871086 RepID=UPI002E135118|nr:hypothetical protein [Brevundimonas sp.]